MSTFIENVYIKDGEYTKIIYTMVHTVHDCIYIYVYKFEIFIKKTQLQINRKNRRE